MAANSQVARAQLLPSLNSLASAEYEWKGYKCCVVYALVVIERSFFELSVYLCVVS